MVSEAAPEHAKVARERLQRWGFNPARQCCLHSRIDVNNLLVRLPGRDEVFPCLDYRDRMHGIFIFLHRTIMETLCSIDLQPAQRRVFDERLAEVCSLRSFRDHTGRAYRRQKGVFEDTGMTAADKICWVFLIPHVLGHVPDMLPGWVHTPLITAIAHTQLIFIAVSGRRMYSKVELDHIFDRGYLTIFRALEQIRAIQYNAHVDRHTSQPNKYPPPKRVKLQSKEWKDFSTPNTDTEDSNDECRTGGLGYYSHGQLCLQHQHWVEQVISAGGFNVHCTQSAEAKHKVCMHLASIRVLHRDANSTQSSMLQYLLLRSLFQDMKKRFTPAPPIRTRNYSCGLRHILFELPSVDRFSSVKFQETILHREVRLAGVELLDLLCDKFGLPDTRASYARLESLSYVCGQQLIRDNGYALWATDSNYMCDGRNDKRRRDVLWVKGSELESDEVTRNALCCEAVMFLTVSKLESADFLIPSEVVQHVDPDTNELTFVLGRWFTPHDTVFERDSCFRPICPGPLRINQCLWKYATAKKNRHALVTTGVPVPKPSFIRQYRFFGPTVEEATATLELEKRAYYCLLSDSNIIDTVAMTPVFLPGTSKLDRRTWLQTVTVL